MCSAIWLAIVHVGTNNASSLPMISAAWLSSCVTIGSSRKPKPHGLSAARTIASTMAGVGRATKSDLRSMIGVAVSSWWEPKLVTVEDRIGDFLGCHQGGKVGVGAGDDREYRGVDNA